MKNILATLSIIFASQAYSYELDEIYYFPKRGESELTVNVALKEFEIEYEDSSVAIGGDNIQEFDQQVLLFKPTYKHSLTDRLLIKAAFVYQSKDLETNFEDVNDNKIPTSSENGFFDPSIQLRYRFIKKDTVFLDALFNQTFKTNAYIEGNRTRVAQPYSGQHTSRLTSEVGYKFSKILLKTHLSIAFLSDIEKQFVILDDTFESDFTYSVGFGGTVLLRASENINISGAFTSISVNAYDMKSPLNTVHIDKVLTAIINLEIEYKKFEKSIGRLSLGFGVDTTKNRLTYNNSQDIVSEAQSILTTLGINKRF